MQRVTFNRRGLYTLGLSHIQTFCGNIYEAEDFWKVIRRDCVVSVRDLESAVRGSIQICVGQG